LASLKWVPGRLYQAAEDAAFKTSHFRNQECPGEKLDCGLSACLFRFNVLRTLKSNGVETETDEGEWTLDSLPFLGMSFLFEDQHVRILKGRNGELPGCGTRISDADFTTNWQNHTSERINPFIRKLI